jgi:hypothetical protein
MFSPSITELRLRRSPRLAVTALEDRCVPAATATIVNGTLAIIGDNGNQTITVTDQGNRSYRVDGLTVGPRLFPDVKYLSVNLKGGTDTVNLVGGQSKIPNGVTITGTGALTVTNNRFHVDSIKGSFTVMDAGTSNVNVFIQPGTFLGKAFNVTTGSGNDTVVMGAGAGLVGSALLNLGGGTNKVSFTGAILEGRLTVSGGTANDTVELTNTTLGEVWAGGLNLNLGGGSDTVKLSNLSVKGNGQVVSANGTLNLDIASANFQGYLDTGAAHIVSKFTTLTLKSWLRVATKPAPNDPHADGVEIVSSQIGGDLKVQTGANSHLLIVHATKVEGNAAISGDGGAYFRSTGLTVNGGLVIDYDGCPATKSAEVYLKQLTVRKTMSIATGPGDDGILLDQATIGDLVMSFATTITSNSGKDTISLGSSAFYTSVAIDAGNGNDTVDLGSSNFFFYRGLKADGGIGTDSLRLGFREFGPNFVNFENVR